MQIERLDHVNLRTTRLDDMVAWYTEVLGLENGWRPNFGFPGAWLYAGEHAIVHMTLIGDEAVGAETDLKIEHFAMTATGAPAFEQRLTERGAHHEKVLVSDTGMVAFNIWDPDGNHIHVDFAGDEVAG